MQELDTALERGVCAGAALGLGMKFGADEREDHLGELLVQFFCLGRGEAGLLIWTGADTWKVKRIRRDPRVLIAPADYRGRELGPHVEAQARVLGPEAGAVVVPLLRRKYGWQRRALEIQARLSSRFRRRPPAAPVYLELTPVGSRTLRSRTV